MKRTVPNHKLLTVIGIQCCESALFFGAMAMMMSFVPPAVGLDPLPLMIFGVLTGPIIWLEILRACNRRFGTGRYLVTCILISNICGGVLGLVCDLLVTPNTMLWTLRCAAIGFASGVPVGIIYLYIRIGSRTRGKRGDLRERKRRQEPT